MMNLQRERWAEALAVEKLHGAGAATHIAERVGDLASAGDLAGVRRWREIAERLEQLQFGTVH